MAHFKVKATFTCSPELIVDRLLSADQRVLLFGERGSGKSTLTAGMPQALNRAGNSRDLIGTNTSLPLFGITSAACLGHW